ncbi:hypothetical protein ANCCEY_13859 [Ancylostoma ceylanicum]|uniref:Metal cation transporter, ZIP family n=1 Tax=Ancylostoma ceylanicum TaxID=53326 RepID=A0A0D6L7V3_9BILA|nr:hypothetical protein ANCCEY_13859 [Ancylostoma ceylanicum]
MHMIIRLAVLSSIVVQQDLLKRFQGPVECMASDGWFSENTKKALIYGTVATTVVSLLSLSGACIIPLLRGKAKHRWMHFFVAMAVATLSSDAILHIIPQLLGAHDHDLAHGHHHHDHHGSIADAGNITQAWNSTATANHADHDHEHDHDHDHERAHAHDHNHDEHTVDKRHAHTHDDHHESTDQSLPSWLALNDERRILLRLSAILLLIYLLASDTGSEEQSRAAVFWGLKTTSQTDVPMKT